MSKPTTISSLETFPKGRVFRFKQSLEDAKWGSVPFTVFCFGFILMIMFYQHPQYTIDKKLQHVGLFLVCILGSNYAFYMWWRTPRTLIVTEETLIGKRVIGKDIILPWSSITMLKRVIFHWKWAGLKVVSKPLRCSFIIGDEIEGFEELMRLIQYHVRLHNPSAQFIGLSPLSPTYQPASTSRPPTPLLPPWLRFEVSTRARSWRGPVVTLLGTVGLGVALWHFQPPHTDPAYAVRLAQIAAIVLTLGVLLWLIDWTKTGQSETD